MEPSTSLTDCNETIVEKKIKIEQVSQDEVNIEDEYKAAPSCIGFERDEWNKYKIIVNVVLLTLLFFALLLMVLVVMYVVHIVYMIVQKKIFTSNVVKKEF